MFEEEAIEQMELLDHRSFIFFNASADAICMLYKRHDGDYGIIEIE
jgi:putative sigma-54 modulation protein